MCKIPTNMRTATKVLHGYPKKHNLDIEWIANELYNRFKIKMGHSTLERYLNPNDDLKLPADLVFPICKICNDDFSVCSILKKYESKIDLTISTVAQFTKEAGEAISELAAAMEDGKMDHEEKKRCVKELLDLKEMVNQILAHLIE